MWPASDCSLNTPRPWCDPHAQWQEIRLVVCSGPMFKITIWLMLVAISFFLINRLNSTFSPSTNCLWMSTYEIIYELTLSNLNKWPYLIFCNLWVYIFSNFSWNITSTCLVNCTTQTFGEVPHGWHFHSQQMNNSHCHRWLSFSSNGWCLMIHHALVPPYSYHLREFSLLSSLICQGWLSPYWKWQRGDTVVNKDGHKEKCQTGLGKPGWKTEGLWRRTAKCAGLRDICKRTDTSGSYKPQK